VLKEYTSPQAFAGLRAAGRKAWNPSAALMVADHVNPTAARRTREMSDADAARQVDYFAGNAREFGIEYFDILDPHQWKLRNTGSIRTLLPALHGDRAADQYVAHILPLDGYAQFATFFDGFMRRREIPVCLNCTLIPY